MARWLRSAEASFVAAVTLASAGEPISTRLATAFSRTEAIVIKFLDQPVNARRQLLQPLSQYHESQK